MSNILVVGVKGEEGLWLIDTGAMKVERVDAASAAGDQAQPSPRKGALVEGVDFAVATDCRSEAAGHLRFA